MYKSLFKISGKFYQTLNRIMLIGKYLDVAEPLKLIMQFPDVLSLILKIYCYILYIEICPLFIGSLIDLINNVH